jgi:hypothetical protein
MSAVLSINSLSLTYTNSLLTMTWNVTGTVAQGGGPTLTIDTLNITATNTVSSVATNYNLTSYGGNALNSYTSVSVANFQRTYTNVGTTVTIPIDVSGLNLTVGQSYNFSVQAFGTSQATGFPPPQPLQTYSNVFTNSTNPVQIGNSCFLKGTKIRCPNGEIDIEKLKKGMLVSTLYHGDVAVDMVGYSRIHHSRALPVMEQLYTYLADDENDTSLTVTGSHARLVDHVNAREIEGILLHTRSIFVTDDKIRLPACIDKKVVPYEKEESDEVVYHLALEHPNESLNYGVWANGRLMETCQKWTIERTMTIKIDDE